MLGPIFMLIGRSPAIPILGKTSLSRLTCRNLPIFCCLAEGKLGADSPVFAKEFLAQNGLGTELLREVGVPKVGHHVFGIWFRIEGDQDEPFVWFGDGVWCCVRDEWCCGSS